MERDRTHCGRECGMVRNVAGELKPWGVGHGVAERRRRDCLHGVGVAFAVYKRSVDPKQFGCRTDDLFLSYSSSEICGGWSC